MKILALEFSSAHRSVAALHAAPDRTILSLGEVVDSAERSSQTFALVEQALDSAQFEREQLDVLVVGIGPGSYTGIRSAIAVAQGWQLARSVNLLPISSIECLAAQAHADGMRGNLSVVVDAQREEFYLATYNLGTDQWQEIEPLRLVPLLEVEQRRQTGARLLGPGADRWFSTAQVDFPRAAVLARLALGRTDFVPAEQLAPIYLRETKFVKAPPPRLLP